jgi:DNA mismatch repair protein MSH3
LIKFVRWIIGANFSLPIRPCMKAAKGAAPAKKPAAAAGSQASISSFFKPKVSAPAAPVVAAEKPSERVKEAAERTDDKREVASEPHAGGPGASAAAGAAKRPRPEEKAPAGSREAKKPAPKQADADDSDDEAPVRRTRRRVRVSLKESSSEAEDDDESAAAVTIDSDAGSEGAPAVQSGEPTPIRSAAAAKRDEVHAAIKPKASIGGAASGTGKGRMSAACGKRGKDKQDDEVMDVDEDRHDMFVKKVGLFQKNQMASAADTGPTERKKEDYGGKLQPCLLNFPRGAKLTPFEDQVVQINKKHPDKVLLVECGYKYKFLGRDAEIAAKVLFCPLGLLLIFAARRLLCLCLTRVVHACFEWQVLNIFHHIDHNFLVASIPTFRLQVHTRRLVEAGYKVGVVRQMETAALKAAGDNRNKQFKSRVPSSFPSRSLIACSGGGDSRCAEIVECLSCLVCMLQGSCARSTQSRPCL